jgi:transcriptional regulator with XRE-family HTH domain
MLPIGKIIRQRRKDAGFTIAALARKAGVKPSTLGSIETGMNGPGYWTMVRLVLALEDVKRVAVEQLQRKIYYQGYRDGKGGRKENKRYAYKNQA